MAITSNVTSTNAVLSGLLPVYFEKRMLPRLYANLQFYRLGQIRSIPRNQGKTIVFNRPVKFGAKTTPLTEGATPAQSNASSEIVSGTVKQYGDWVSKSDFADMTLLDLDWMAEEFEYSARLTIDQLIRNELRASASAVVTAEAGVSSDTTMQAEFLRRIRAFLTQQDVPGLFDGGTRFAYFVSPEASYDLMADTSAGGWHDSVKQAAGDVHKDTYINGFLREMLGFRLYETTNLFVSSKASGGGTATYTECLGFGRDAYGVVQIAGGGGGNLSNPQVIMQPLGSGGTEDPLRQRATLGWKVAMLPLYLGTTSDAKRAFLRRTRTTF